jgi:hypothetical protein
MHVCRHRHLLYSGTDQMFSFSPYQRGRHHAIPKVSLSAVAISFQPLTLGFNRFISFAFACVYILFAVIWILRSLPAIRIPRLSSFPSLDD